MVLICGPLDHIYLTLDREVGGTWMVGFLYFFVYEGMLEILGRLYLYLMY